MSLTPNFIIFDPDENMDINVKMTCSFTQINVVKYIDWYLETGVHTYHLWSFAAGDTPGTMIDNRRHSWHLGVVVEYDEASDLTQEHIIIVKKIKFENWYFCRLYLKPEDKHESNHMKFEIYSKLEF